MPLFINSARHSELIFPKQPSSSGEPASIGCVRVLLAVDRLNHPGLPVECWPQAGQIQVGHGPILGIPIQLYRENLQENPTASDSTPKSFELFVRATASLFQLPEVYIRID